MNACITLALAAVLAVTAIACGLEGGEEASGPATDGGGASEPTPTPTADPSPTPSPTPVGLEGAAEGCIPGLENQRGSFGSQMRPLLLDGGSLQVVSTRVQVLVGADDYVYLWVTYTARNGDGEHLQNEAYGQLFPADCEFVMLDEGFSGGVDAARRAPAATPRSTVESEDAFYRRVQRCLSVWDGNHNGFEDQIRPLLNDEDSMKTLRTYWYATSADALDSLEIYMDYQARNIYGAVVKTTAIGQLFLQTCRVTVLDYGF